MTLSVIWVVCMAGSILYSCAAGTTAEISAAVLEGVQSAVDFALVAGVIMCLWCGIFEVMARCGLTGALTRLLRPVLRRLFPHTARHGEVFDALSANVAANLLGLGNAATPMGIRAASGMAALPDRDIRRELSLLVVLNTASIQLLPTTIASVRAACGAAVPFDILPAVWITSVCSVAAGVLAVKVLER